MPVKDAYEIVVVKDAAALKKIRPGQVLHFATDDAGDIKALRYPLDVFTTLQVSRDAENWRAETITRAPEIRVQAGSATIRSNLFAAAKSAGVDYGIVFALAQLFGWQVDFAREIRAGDSFSVIFEAQYLDGEKVGNGDILAAELTNNGRTLRAVRHIYKDGRRAYFAPDGGGIQRSFLRSPLEFSRVTSRFSHKRFHPILKKWRAHRGVDYGAPRGTPVQVDRRRRGEKNFLKSRLRQVRKHPARREIQHALRALKRLRNAGIKPGARVAQGEVIGYVGSTGWATGAHLHYEFRVDGIHRNPLTVELPTSDAIADEYRAEFVADAAIWVARLQGVGDDVAGVAGVGYGIPTTSDDNRDDGNDGNRVAGVSRRRIWHTCHLCGNRTATTV